MHVDPAGTLTMAFLDIFMPEDSAPHNDPPHSGSIQMTCIVLK
jgi:hypothetical protein